MHGMLFLGKWLYGLEYWRGKDFIGCEEKGLTESTSLHYRVGLADERLEDNLNQRNTE